MAERQIEDRKSCLVLSTCFPVVNWHSRPVAKSAYLLSRGVPGRYATKAIWISNYFSYHKQSNALVKQIQDIVSQLLNKLDYF